MDLRSPLRPSNSVHDVVLARVDDAQRSLGERMERNPYVQPSAAEYALRMRNCQALDFDNKTSAVHTLEELHKTRGRLLFELLWDLLAYVLIGLCTGVLAFAVFQAVALLDGIKHSLAMHWLHHGSPVAAFAWWIGLSLIYGLVSTLLVVFVGPAAAGSGVPEVKAYLNGTDVPRFLLPITCLVKAVGICFSVTAGLVIGKEGPLIHIGAALGSLFSQELAPAAVRAAPGWPASRFHHHGSSASSASSVSGGGGGAIGGGAIGGGGGGGSERAYSGSKRGSLCWQSSWFMERTDRQKRDFVSAGAAAGVAAAFSSPLGGICFAFEEAATYWNVQLTWRVFLACTVTTTALWVAQAARRGDASFHGLLKYGSFEVITPLSSPLSPLSHSSLTPLTPLSPVPQNAPLFETCELPPLPSICRW